MMLEAKIGVWKAVEVTSSSPDSSVLSSKGNKKLKGTKKL